ncbi:fatty acid desaturase [Aestuariivita sp.]|jgi:fatty acid desaturase|uniref:fatty acid desaturase n=1 Tax=Aestuariivita sp. TaxID=1872407 RepID=UPI00216E8C74|nr:fatty acid desaturase [Aestuariivita sp.]MCE8009392.1 fatty acid desaturase [Aestuariivita sp.]
MTLHAGAIAPPRARAVEWPTFLMILACYGLWALVTALVFVVAPVLSVLVTGVLIAFHASLTHEALHGHPFRSRMLNEVLMALPLNLCIPYNRFRDLHLAHHQDQRLTDPYDDPESNYLDPDDWDRMTGWKRAIFTLNNTLLGRMVIGPILGQILFVQSEWRAAWAGNRAVWLGWALHLPGVASVLAWVVLATDMPVWAYLIAVHIGLALLKIRTFLEHQAHEHARARTVIIEDRGPLAFLFLNNNLHVVHHMHPRVPWYRLPGLYRQNKARYLERNDGYLYRSYVDVFARFLFRPKDPVPHPLWHRR